MPFNSCILHAHWSILQAHCAWATKYLLTALIPSITVPSLLTCVHVVYVTVEQHSPKGSCDKCEMKCNNIFLPTCSSQMATGNDNGGIIFPNKCHAKCSGIEFEDCKGLQFPSIIPGKSKLPPKLPISKKSPSGLQDISLE